MGSESIFETKKAIIDEDVSPVEETSQDSDFNPYLAKTKKSVSFKITPSKTSTSKKTLPRNRSLYLFSKNDVNGYSKAIDIETGKVGWVKKSAVAFIKKAKVDDTGMFESTGSSSNYNSEVSIINKSSKFIAIIIGQETFNLKPNSTKAVTINPGKKYYVASSAGVIPKSGYQTFDSNKIYEWTFWVVTRYR